MESSTPTNFEMTSISVALPCFNEEGNIERVLWSVIAKMEMLSIPFEIIVVDDGSMDQSAGTVKRIQQNNPSVKLVRHADNRGYGEALRSGFNAARNEWILLMDADGQFDIQDIDTLVPYTHESDMILGFRQNRADPWYRIALTAVYTVIIRYFFFAVPLRDMSCGFKLFRYTAWEAAQPIMSTDHKLFTAEWLHNSIVAGMRIKEIPVSHYPRVSGHATGAQLGVVFAMVKAMGKVLRRQRK